MTGWFRMYGEVINDPKVMRLAEAMRWHWVAVLCTASMNDGRIPVLRDLAFLLRMREQQAAAILTELHAGGLLDKVEGGFVPHNWNGRQYKSDVSTERVKRFRNKQRNVSFDVSETAPETEQNTETEQTQKTEANASGAGAPRDVRAELFGRGLQTLARLTGKGPDACRSFVGKCLKAAGDDAVTVLGLIEDAERNQVVDPSAWIVARLKGTGPPVARHLTEFQRGRNETKEILNDLGNYATGGGGGKENSRVLRGDPCERSEGIRGGAGADVIDLPAIGVRAGG